MLDAFEMNIYCLKKEENSFVSVVLKKLKGTRFFIVVSLITHIPLVYSVFICAKNRNLYKNNLRERMGNAAISRFDEFFDTFLIGNIL